MVLLYRFLARPGVRYNRTMTTTLPKHLLPVLRHLVVWEEAGEKRRRPFATRSEAEAFLEELEARGVRALRLKA